MVCTCSMCGIESDSVRAHGDGFTCADCTILLDSPKQRAGKIVVMPQSDNEHGRIYHTRAFLGESEKQALLEIDGVSRVYLDPYSVLVVKGHCFDWDEIHLQVIEVITGALEAQGI